jgi:ankyrin repeat protein
MKIKKQMEWRGSMELFIIIIALIFISRRKIFKFKIFNHSIKDVLGYKYNTSAYYWRELTEKDLLAQINNGLNIHYIDGDCSALMYAVIYKANIEVIKVLIYSGVDINFKSNNGDTVLCTAVENGNMEVIKLLVENNADINVKNNDGITLLMKSVNNFEVFKYLHDKGLSLKNIDFKGNSLLFHACCPKYGVYNKTPNKKVIEYILNTKIDINYTNNNGESVLIYITKNSDSFLSKSLNVEIVKMLLKRDIDINIKDNNGCNVFIYAIGNYFSGIFEVLTENFDDMSFNIKDYNYKNLLMYSVGGLNLEYVKFLLGSDLDINAQDNNGKTALMYATEGSRKKEVIPMLLDAGADVNIVDNEGKTVLHHEVGMNPRDNIIKDMISKGIDVNVKDNEGRDALLYMLSRKVESSSSLYIAEILLENGANINTINSDGDSLLTLELKRSEIEATKLDKISGNYFYCRDTHIKFFIKHGIDIDIANKQGKKPLDYLRVNSSIYDIITNGK